MSNNIDLKGGLNIPISGTAVQKTRKTIVPDVIAVKPTDFKGLIPRLLVKEGDKVLAGSPVLADKKNPDILFSSPVSGTVAEIVRGEKRKLLEVRIKADAQQEFVDFGVHKPAEMQAEDIKALLLKSGLWPSLVQRPYGVLADPAVKPKAIFVSAFTTAPLAAAPEFVFKDEIANIQTGVNALNKLTDGGIHFSLCRENYSGTPLHKVENVIQHVFTGKHPAGNVGVQISHISPIMKGDTVWTVSLLLLAAIGKLFNTGKYNMARKIAVTGPKAIEPAYVDALPGINFDYKVGDLMIIKDHINLLPNPLIGPNLDEFGPRFPDMTHPYDKKLIAKAKEIASEAGIPLREGVYIAGTGPSYETPAEWHFFRTIGADAVGMSTVPEVIVARHSEIPVFGMSVITNAAQKEFAADYKNDGDDVVKAADAAADKMTYIFSKIIESL